MTPDGPCTWPHDPCPCEPLEAMSEAEQTEIVGLASWLLWAATGRVFGPCPVSVMPCRMSCGCQSWRRCGCRTPSEVKLPGPVHSITEVVVDGVVLANTAYRVDDWAWLVRLDGGRWPTQNIEDPDAFRVDYLLGIEPPPGAGTVTGILAAELAKAKCNDKTCRLPARVRTVQKQGLTMAFGADNSFGLPEVDMWVSRLSGASAYTQSPTSLTPKLLAGAVWSPDMPTVRQITWVAS